MKSTSKVQEKKQTGLQRFNEYITHPKADDYLSSVLGERKAQFVTNIVSVVSNSSLIQECTPNSIMYSAIKATSLGLSLDSNLGLAYIVPYKNKEITEAQLQIGYKGFVQLSIRSGQFKTINYSEVKKGEIKSENRLSGEITFQWEQDRKKRKSLETIGYVAYFKLNNGFEKTSYMSIEEAKGHGKRYSQSFKSAKEYVVKSSLWTTDFDFMSLKTVLKLLLSKFAPLSTEMQTAIKYDQSVIRSESDAIYIDNTIDVVNYEEIKMKIQTLLTTLKIEEEDSMLIEMSLEKEETENYEEILKQLEVKAKKQKMNKSNVKLP